MRVAVELRSKVGARDDGAAGCVDVGGRATVNRAAGDGVAVRIGNGARVSVGMMCAIFSVVAVAVGVERGTHAERMHADRRSNLIKPHYTRKADPKGFC